MLNRFPSRPQVLALLLVILTALSALGWLWWCSHRREDISFLPRIAPAEWIVYPSSPEIVPHPRLAMSTVFERSFRLEQAPPEAVLAVTALGHYTLFINGATPAAPVQVGRNWKQPDRFDVAKLLRAGENQIAVEVSNTNGPPVLWLSLAAGGLTLRSDESWQASYAGAEWGAAHLASKPKAAMTGSPIHGGEESWSSLRNRWQTLLLFAVLSIAGWWLLDRRPRRATDHTRLNLQGAVHRPVIRELLPLVVLAALWLALFINNVGVLSPLYGFDVEGHMAYIRYIQERHALPLAHEGWEMYQPPLYYVLCAAVLNLLSLSVAQEAGVTALRFLGLGIGVTHVVLVWASLRLLFPGEESRQRWGLALAAFLPPLLYLSQYVTNEGLAAALVSASVYLTLRILHQPQMSWKVCVGLGLCLGAALLTKSTALLAVLPIVGALLWKAWLAPPSRFRLLRWGLVPVICVTVCGWHYVRLWVHYGSPLAGNWDPRLGFSWWQDYGYGCAAFYARFGESLLRPWFSSLNGFADGIYSTLWGDGLLGGGADLLSRPPWNYDLMAVGYWLALLPTLGVLAGGALALVKFMRQPAAEWFLILGLGAALALSVAHMSMAVPYSGMAKAFYGLAALVPLCAFGAWGLDALSRRSAMLQTVVWILLGLWAINAYASFWIARSSVATLLSRARPLTKEGRTVEAVGLLRAALARDPQNTALRPLLARLLDETGDAAGALQQVEMAVRNQPENADARLTLAGVLAGKERTEEAVEQARRAIALAPGLGEGYQKLAALLVKQRSWDEAIRASRQGLRLAPFSAELRITLGTALLTRSLTNDAIAQMQLACGLRPQWPAPQALLGNLLTRLGRLDEAATLYAQAAGTDATNAAPHLELAEALVAQGRDDEAISQYRAALAIQPGAEAARFGLGEALRRKGRYAEAVEQFSEVLKLQPTRVPALVQLGVARARLGKPDEAVQVLSEALRLDPRAVAAHNNLGNVLAQLGRHEEAVREFEEAVRLKPDHASAYNNLAISCKKLGRIGDAIAHYREALRLQPDSLQALNNLAWLLAAHPDAQFRNGAEAVALATRACDLTKHQNPVALGTLAAAYAEAGRFQEAVAHAERAQQVAGASQGAFAARLAAMLDAFRNNRSYHAD